MQSRRRRSAALIAAMAVLGGTVLTAAESAAAGTHVPEAAHPAKDVAHPASYVDPFIGSAHDGNTWPGAIRPFGMASWSPTTTKGDQTGTGAAGGYQYDVRRVRGFALTHVNGTGCDPGAAGDLPVMPYTGKITGSPSADTEDKVYASGFSHSRETARPGRYTVGLNSGVTADLSATRRSGVGEFTFPAKGGARLLFRTSNSLNGSEDADIRIDRAHRKVTGSVLTGAFCGRRANGGENNRKSYYRLHFTAHFDRDFAENGTWHDGTVRHGGTAASGGEGYATGEDRAGRGSGGWVGFDPSRGRTVRMRVGLSYTSAANAEANLRAEVGRSATVAGVAAAGYRDWDRHLRRIRLPEGAGEPRRVFYTALYHSLLQPNLMSDANGDYLGMDRRRHRLSAGQRAQYGNFSGWDQYRAQVQLLALLEPRVAGDFAQSLYNYSRQNHGVWDRWVQANGATHVMTGDPSAATLATFYAMGVRDFDVRGAFASLVRQAQVPRRDGLSDAGCPGQCVGARPNLRQYLSSHYSAHDVCHCWGGASETLEASLADSALADWAGRLGHEALRKKFAARASYWRNTFNPKAAHGRGYVQARRLDGGWVTPFSPSTQTGFAQGDSATYTWMVPQDVASLAHVMGGRKAAAERLDGFFHDADGDWSVGGGDPLRYDPANEPGIHTPWLYNGLGRPWKTQATVRRIADTVYGTGPSGLPGNDDLGTMSAWYVFAALGMYPQTPGRAELLLSAPRFTRAVVHRSSGATISVSAPAASHRNRYIGGATLNGRTHRASWVGPSLLRGGALHFRLRSTPDKRWGTGADELPRDHPGGG